MFTKTPTCEVCNQKAATTFAFLETEPPEGDWKFCCECTTDEESYYILIEKFFSRPAVAVDWLAHMHEKSWMDWKNFMNMIHRFRDATGSLGAL